MNDETTNKAVKDNEIRAKDWRFRDLSERLYTWFDLFNDRFFKNALRIPVISFEKTRVRTLGHFVLERNPFGLKWNININMLYVELPLADTLATLLHEMAHQHQQDFGEKDIRQNRGNYHNKEFRTKTKLMGIPSDQYGATLYYQNPFVSFLKDHGVTIEREPISNRAAVLMQSLGKSKLKKWSCGCTNVRVAVLDFRAKCLKCGNEFQQVW